MILTNYKRGYNSTFDCVIHGTIYMTIDEWNGLCMWLSDQFRRLEAESPYFRRWQFWQDCQRKIKTNKGFLVNIRTTATKEIAKRYGLTKYKAGNYQLSITT